MKSSTRFSMSSMPNPLALAGKRGQARISPKAVRLEDGSIQATCSGTEYRVGTLFNTSEGRVIEISINCRKAKELPNVDC